MTDLILEPFGGLAGDMLLAALLDLGDPRFALEDLRALSARLVGDEARLEASETQRAWLRATHLSVRTPETERAPHRHLGDLCDLLARAELPGDVRARAEAVLRRIAVAEAEVHGISIDEVHFHEVGAVDTLIDVAGAALALSRLGVERVFSTAPLVGSGTVTCAHGELPVPAPATALLLRGLPQRRGGAGERLTPTGAALLAELVDSFDPDELGAVRVVCEGYGAGTADPREGPPNLVRAALVEPAGDPTGATAGATAGDGNRAEAWLMEVTLDDTTGEELGFALDELYAAGALEAWTHAVAMKKGRPGVVLSALCRADVRAALERVVFEHTPTLGVRWARRERTECERERLEVELDGRSIAVKVRLRPGARPRGGSSDAGGEPGPGGASAVRDEDLSPEHDDVAAVARATGRTLRAVERDAIALARRALDGPR